MARRLARFLLMAVTASTLAVGCSDSESESPSRPPLVLVVTLDTTRADRLGCYGYSEDTSPHLDAVAAQGIVFDQAYTCTPLTLPAHASLMSGNYPFWHGVRDNGIHRLEEPVLTLAECLSQDGYQTAAFVASAVLDSVFGLSQGFDHYDDGDFLTAPSEGESSRAERSAKTVTDAVLSFVDTQSTDKPLFLWVHYFDPHWPYQPESPFAERFEDPYDAEIAYTDSHLGRLLTSLGQRFDLDRSLTVITSDHGEDFWEHGEKEHGFFLYDSTVRIPLVLRGPGISPGTRSDAVVSIVDVFPTLLELAGWEGPVTSQGRNLLIEGEGEDAYLEIYHPHLSYGWSWLEGVRIAGSPLKYIDAPERELYDVQADPSEKVNLYGRDAERDAAFEGRVEAFKRRAPPRPESLGDATMGSSSTIDRALEQLGYTGGTATISRERGPDPKVAYEALNHYREGRRLLQQGKTREALEKFNAFIDGCPRKGKPNQYAGSMLTLIATRQWQAGEKEGARALFAHAIPYLEKAIDDLPFLVDLHYQLAVAFYHVGGRDEEYEESLKAVLSLDDRHASARYRLAEWLATSKRGEEAREHYEAFLEVTPPGPRADKAAFDLARLHLVFEDLEAAQACFQGLEGAPEGAWGLARVAELLEDIDRARAEYERCLSLLETRQPVLFPNLRKKMVQRKLDQLQK